MNSLNNLKEYNSQLFKDLTPNFDHLQIGFFNGSKILFIGQNPGLPFDEKTTAATNFVKSKPDFETFEPAYEQLIMGSRIGQYLGDVILDDWQDISFTNIVKVATVDNGEPSNELYEFFFPILMKQIDLLQPQVIACLGKYAGSVFELEEFYYARRYKSSVVCMYPHPSYILRQGSDATIAEQVKMKLSLQELVGWSYQAKAEHETKESI